MSTRLRTKIRARALAATLLLAILPIAASAQGAAGVRGAGTDNRMWVSEALDPGVSPAAFEVVVDENVPVEMRDGTVLKVHVFRPDAPGQFPCLLEQVPYGKDTLGGGTGNSQHRDFASRGYVSVLADPRGAGASQGQLRPFSPESQQDGYDLIEWAAAQPWCTGEVGTFGTSFMGISQYLSAKLRPPSLKTMIPVQGTGDIYRGTWYGGGMPPGADRAASGAHLAHALSLAPPGDLDAQAAFDHLSNAYYYFYGEAIQHPTYDDWWVARTTNPGHTAQWAEDGISILFQDGWLDYYLWAQVTTYEDFVAAGGKGKLVIGPWAHGGEGGVLPYDFQSYRNLWFDRYLKGATNSVDEEPPVLIWVQGANEWRFESAWPIPDARIATLYFRQAINGDGTSSNDGTLSIEPPVADEAPVAYEYLPIVTNNAGDSDAPPATDQRQEEANGLTWTSPALDAPTEITGWLPVRFWTSSSAEDTDYVFEITDVHPDGSSFTVTRGRLKASHRNSHVNPDPLVPGQIYELEVRVWPTSYVFETGHRIRVAMSGSDVPGRNPNPLPATVTVYQDAEHPSSIVLPIVGTSTLLPPNEPPVAEDDMASVVRGESVEIDVKANDEDLEDDREDLSVTIDSAPSYGTVLVDDAGTVTYTHDESEGAADVFTYRLTDRQGASDIATVSVTVNDPPPHEQCVSGLCDDGKPGEVTFVFRGGDCTASSNTQGGKADCTDHAEAMGSTVFIRATSKEDAYDDGAKLWFEGEVSVGETFTLQASMSDEDDFGSKVFMHVLDAEGGALLQTVEVHTSCSVPMVDGERFGSLELGEGTGTGAPNLPQCVSQGRVHGSGAWDRNAGGAYDRVKFHLDAKFRKGTLKGKLKVEDKDADVKIHAKTITSLTTGVGSDCNGLTLDGARSFELTALGSFTSVGITTNDVEFRACGVDNGKGSSAPPDVLYVEVLSPQLYYYDTGSRVEDDLVDNGNVHLHDAIE